MTDIYSADKRREVMSGIRASGTTAELRVEAALSDIGVEFRTQETLPGRPDFWLPAGRVALFVHGCFWHRHGCRRGKSTPASNHLFWKKKLEANRARDEVVRQRLVDSGIRVEVIWECETNNEERMRELVRRLDAQ